jgi:hypothetical protein
MSDRQFIAISASNNLLGTAIDMAKIKQRPDIKKVAYLIDNLKR